MQAISKNVCNVHKGFVGVFTVCTNDTVKCLQVIWRSVYNCSQNNQYDKASIINSWKLVECLHCAWTICKMSTSTICAWVICKMSTSIICTWTIYKMFMFTQVIW